MLPGGSGTPPIGAEFSVRESVEADAIPPADLRALVEEAITQHIDKRVLNTTKVAERSERELQERGDLVDRR